jgi:DNA-binding response OmpR family regulator
MNASFQYRALVVDDEPMVRQATMRALSRAGFTCEAASNGNMAMDMARQTRYDAVVTDLRMPEANGHQLAVDLLGMADRPAIVVLTGVLEPKLSDDLKARGVDDILFKPVEYDLLAKKVQAVVEQRELASSLNNRSTAFEEQPHVVSPEIGQIAAVAAHPVVTQLSKAAAVLRTPPANFDGFAKASSNIFGADDLATAIEQEPGFAREVLRFANKLLYTSHHALGELQKTLGGFQQNSTMRVLTIFAGGVLVGWLLSWLGAGLLFR